MKARYTIMVALMGLMMAGLTGCNEDKDAAAEAAAKKGGELPVKVMKLQKHDVTLEETWFGRLRGVNQADIRPEVSGRIISQNYKDGQLCQEGEVLFQIDPAVYEATVNQCKAAEEIARVTLSSATDDVERFEALRVSAKGAISDKDYTDAVKRQEAAKAQVKQAQAALALAQINLERCTIRAPFTGLVSQAKVSVGDFVSAGAVVVTSMSSVDPIRVDFVIPGKHMLSKIKSPDFKPGEEIVSPISGFTLILEDGSTYVDANGTPVAGEVKSVDSVVNKSTGTVNFIGHVANPGLKLRAGSPVRVKAKVGELKDAYLVPSRAFVSAMNHRYLFVVGPDGEPCGLDVQLGPEVVLEMPNGDGKTVPMQMQVVTGTVAPIPAMLHHYGITNPEEAQIIVEGGLQAAMLAQQNAQARANGAKDGFAKVAPQPFVYESPKTTTPSSTAKPKEAGNGNGSAK